MLAVGSAGPPGGCTGGCGSRRWSPPRNLTRPSGGVSARVVYDPATARVTQVTDANNGVWKIGAPVVSGSSQVYVSSVLAAGPADYWRLAESGTTRAVNQVHGGVATYNQVTQAVAGGPFEDATVAGFNGTTSYLELPAADIPTTGAHSVSLWFRVPAGNTSGGVLFWYQAAALADSATVAGNWTPALYVGTDGKLRGQYWMADATRMITTAGVVNDGQWHHVALAAGTNTQSMYLDGARVGVLAATRVTTDATHAYVGAGKWSGAWPGTSGTTVGYFPGNIAEVAVYRSQLSDAQVLAQATARDKTSGQPVQTVAVTDPDSATATYTYDAQIGRKVAEVDTRGAKTQYGYDVGGFLRTVTDPLGNVTTTEHDVRGNAVSTTTCQDRSANTCSTVYFTYYPDATTRTLTPDPRNDLMLTTRDGRSTSATDNRI